MLLYKEENSDKYQDLLLPDAHSYGITSMRSLYIDREEDLSQSVELDLECEEKKLYKSENIHQIEESGGSSKNEIQLTQKQPFKKKGMKNHESYFTQQNFYEKKKIVRNLLTPKVIEYDRISKK